MHEAKGGIVAHASTLQSDCRLVKFSKAASRYTEIKGFPFNVKAFTGYASVGFPEKGIRFR